MALEPPESFGKLGNELSVQQPELSPEQESGQESREAQGLGRLAGLRHEELLQEEPLVDELCGDCVEGSRLAEVGGDGQYQESVQEDGGAAKAGAAGLCSTAWADVEPEDGDEHSWQVAGHQHVPSARSARRALRASAGWHQPAKTAELEAEQQFRAAVSMLAASRAAAAAAAATLVDQSWRTA